MILSVLAEFIGTWALVFSVYSTGNWLAVGITLAVIILLIGPVSGGYSNPAISLSMYMDNKLSLTKFLAYLLAEFLGAVAALYTYRAVA
jgi:aquaporin Z